MKKILALVGAASLLVNICGCQKQSGLEDRYTSVADYFVYDNVDYDSPLAMTAGEGAELFVAELTEGGTVVRRYDEGGGIAAELPVPYLQIYDMDYDNGSLLIGYAGDTCAAVDRLDLATGETEKLCDFPALSDLRSVSSLGEEIVAIGSSRGKAGTECRYLINGYNQVDYPGRAVYSFKEGAVSEIVTDFPFEAEGFGGSVIIYGCQDDEGFYFRRYTKNGLTAPSYTDQLGEIKSMCAFSEENYILSSISRFNFGTLVAGDIFGDGASEIMPDVFLFGDYRRELTANDGFCWFLDDNAKALTRIKLSAYYKGNKTLTLLSSNLSGANPFSCGYDIRLLRLGNDETALKILSRDKDYDLCCLSSRDPISGNIRDKGSFYPLNDVPGIAEYMDELFPYIKEACTNDEGEIWCLPVSSEVLALYYNDEKCRELGFDMRDISMEDYFDHIDKIKADGLDKSCGYSAYWYVEGYLLKYLSENTSFDTPEFRATAALFAERFPYDAGSLNVNFLDMEIASAAAYEDKTDEFISEMSVYCDYLKNTTLRAASVPYPTDGDAVSLIYLCVNPTSDRLSDALDYLATLAQYIKTLKDIFLFADQANYSDTAVARDLYAIFSAGRVGYAYSDDLYRADLERYLIGELTLDEFIAEADRKLTAYLNE
ncbi:MAG: hypothetical protein NC084_08760 [Bacteroides sp.]|nr:hypothetical protein [Eubacterium sp.]MCM1418719.1 hypothetical protein [Roseburia sp.]MCM1462786.1 hypothetical protein [Bacteroides sp.]